MDNSTSVGMNPKTLRLVTCAVMIALASILSLIPIWQMPFGGTITLCSMLPILLAGYRFGPKWGLMTGFAYSLIQLLIDFAFKAYFAGLGWQALLGSVFLDFIFAFTVLGLAGIYGKGLLKFIFGMITAVVLRFIFHFLSGVIIWSSYATSADLPDFIKGHVVIYSLVYNAFYLVPDLLLCIIVGAIIFRPLMKFLDRRSK